MSTHSCFIMLEPPCRYVTFVFGLLDQFGLHHLIYFIDTWTMVAPPVFAVSIENLAGAHLLDDILDQMMLCWLLLLDSWAVLHFVLCRPLWLYYLLSSLGLDQFLLFVGLNHALLLSFWFALAWACTCSMLYSDFAVSWKTCMLTFELLALTFLMSILTMLFGILYKIYQQTSHTMLRLIKNQQTSVIMSRLIKSDRVRKMMRNTPKFWGK